MRIREQEFFSKEKKKGTEELPNGKSQKKKRVEVGGI